MHYRTSGPERLAVHTSLAGVTLALRPGIAVPRDASPLEAALCGLLVTPRPPVSLCTALPSSPADVATALWRLIDAGVVEVHPARGGQGHPYPTTIRLPDERPVDTSAARCRTLTTDEIRAALELD